MAVIERPVKTYGNRNYVAEVAAAPANTDPILANEVDADFAAIYGAWNGGADTVNLKDGAVTVPKLEPAIQGAVQGKFPGTVTFTPRTQIVPSGTTADVQANTSGSPNFDNTKSSWIVRQDYTADVFQVFRAPAPGTAFAAVLQLDSAGNLIAPGRAQFKAYAGGISSIMLHSYFNGSTAEVVMENAWVDTGGMTMASVNRVVSPPWPAWVTVSARLNTSTPNAGLGIGVNIELWNGSAWESVAAALGSVTTFFSTSVTMPCSASQMFRMTVFPGTGNTINVPAWGARLTIAAHGSF